MLPLATPSGRSWVGSSSGSTKKWASPQIINAFTQATYVALIQDNLYIQRCPQPNSDDKDQFSDAHKRCMQNL